MANTPIYNLPYQSVSDTPNGPVLGQALATAIEAQLVTLNAAVAAVAAASPAAGRSVRRTIAADNNFGNPVAYTVLPQSADRSALTIAFVKTKAATRLTLGVAGTLVLASGVPQRLFIGLRIGGVDYDVGEFASPVAAVNRVMAAGFAEISGLAAGTYTIEPVIRSATAAAVNLYTTDDFVSYTVREAT